MNNDTGSTLSYPLREHQTDDREFNTKEKEILSYINQKVAAGQTLKDIVEFLFNETSAIMPCDRIGIAFTDESGKRLILYHVVAAYKPLHLDRGYAADLRGSSLDTVFQDGTPRVINDLQEYLQSNPQSRSTQLLVKEGVRSSMTCPLYVDQRVVGVLFRSSREPSAYSEHEVKLHKAMSERLSQAVEKAWRIEQLSSALNAYTEMLSFVTHELKSPLSSIITLGKTFNSGYFGNNPEKTAEMVGRMIDKAEYLNTIVNEYLNLSRIEEDRMSIRPKKVDLHRDIIDEAIDIVDPQLQEKNIQLEKNYDTAITSAECDPELMKIVLHNLLSNAVKYGIEKGTVRVTTRMEGKNLHIDIWNEGPGFPEEQKYKLFRRFSRIETDELMDRKGSGIGLFVSYNIAFLHGGRIVADSHEGEWAQFTIEIPQPPQVEQDQN
jgi:signal transduction histidine kinase